MTPVELQRYARQILVPEVGRAGQEAWLASRLTARGSGPALEAAVELLQAAGLQVAREAPEAQAEVEGRVLGASAYADRRAGCGHCLDAFLSAQPAGEEAERFAVAFGLGALVAGDVMLSVLDPRRAPQAMALVPRARVASPVRSGCACRS